MRFPDQPSTGNCVPDFGPRVGSAFRIGPQAETASQNELSEWDELSQRCFYRKLRPGFDAQNGMHFPAEASAESASQNSGSERDALSGWHGTAETTAQFLAPERDTFSRTVHVRWYIAPFRTPLGELCYSYLYYRKV